MQETIAQLRQPTSSDRPATMTRDAVLAPLLERLWPACGPLARRPLTGVPLDHLVPNRELRAVLATDPALAALLAGVSGSILLDERLDRLCRVDADCTVRIASRLIERPAAMVAVARWSLELLGLLDGEALPPARQRVAVIAVLRHGQALLGGLREGDRRAVGALLPAPLAAGIAEPEGPEPGALAAAAPAMAELVAAPWLQDLIARSKPERWQAAGGEVEPMRELCLPLESLLVAGGDERLIVSPATGLNRYGTTPRPRPEAIQFSSSTASSISDYAFRLCATLQSRMLGQAVAGAACESSPHLALADAVRANVGALLGLDPDAADTVMCASGTDTELLTVALALAADDRPLTNILIAPEETGRGVVLAGQGQFFGEVTCLGRAVRKGEPVWDHRRASVRTVSIRDESGGNRPAAVIAQETRAHVAAGLAAGERVLLHVVLGSKTGISAPPLDAVEAIRALDPERVDIVVDACQLRVSPSLLGELVGRGWMVQLSGSKFLTGPAFSGALVLPLAMRGRMAGVKALLDAAPGICAPADWPRPWRERMGLDPSAPAGLGRLLRWAAALCEAELLRALPPAFSRAVFDGFSRALHARLLDSAVLVRLPPPDGHLADLGTEPPGLSSRSIICFALATDDGRGGRRFASLDECQLLFELLNRDVSARLTGLDVGERLLAARPAHIGQPVALRPDCTGAPIVLRLVVGARFFTICGFPDDGDCEAALRSEIADAVTALDKLELLVRQLPFLRLAA